MSGVLDGLIGEYHKLKSWNGGSAERNNWRSMRSGLVSWREGGLRAGFGNLGLWFTTHSSLIV